MDAADDKGGAEIDLTGLNDDLIIPEITKPEVKEEVKSEEKVETKVDTKIETEVPKIKIKYNHEEKEITLDEAKELAQKGLNYDKVYGEFDNLKKNPALSYVEKFAKQYNMTPEEVVQAWQQQDEANEINALAEKENVPVEIAERLYKNEQKTSQLETMFNTEKQTKVDQEKQQVEFSEFFENYPDVKPEAIPKEVWEYKAKTGKSLTDAMAWNENKQLKERIKVLETNASNTKKAPINTGVTTHGSTEIVVEDDFLSGFNSV
jgi:hypothetical protein